jgi:hypothetical protein
MLRCSASATAHQSAAVAIDVKNGSRRVSPISTGLREQCADRSTCILGETSTVGAQSFDSSDLRTSVIRSYFQRSDVAATVTHPKASSIQIGGPGPPSSARRRSIIPLAVHSAV